MPPTRSSKGKGKERAKAKGSSSNVSRDVPSVSKTKAALRQTRRLLAREETAADVRVEAERRLKALEADLVVAERSKLERTMAVRYHKVKFFDRQKILRKIKQAKHSVDSMGTPPESLPALEQTLLSHRVDLNYVRNYPKTKKYISLYPSGTPGDTSAGTSAQSPSNRIQEEIKTWVREAMAKGEMDAEPENATGNPTTQATDPDIQWEDQAQSEDGEEGDSEESDAVEKKRKAKASVGKKKKVKKPSKLQKTLEETMPAVEEDGFFDTEA